MNRPIRPWWLPALAVALASASPARDAWQLLRQGDAAFGRGDYPAAVDLYTRAEEAITDPGLAAFNKAAALYRLGAATDDEASRRHLFHEAELHYRRCLEDAAGDRRARALYDLGNALVQQAQDRDVQVLQEAVACYEHCLRQQDTGPELRQDAGHNLGLARALLLKARAARAAHEAAEPNEDASQKPHALDPRQDRGTGPHSAGYDPAFSNGRGQHAPPDDSGTPPDPSAARANQNPPPGVGHERTIPDQDDLVPMSPEDAQRSVDQAAARILRQRREQWQQIMPPPSRATRDW